MPAKSPRICRTKVQRHHVHPDAMHTLPNDIFSLHPRVVGDEVLGVLQTQYSAIIVIPSFISLASKLKWGSEQRSPGIYATSGKHNTGFTVFLTDSPLTKFHLLLLYYTISWGSAPSLTTNRTTVIAGNPTLTITITSHGKGNWLLGAPQVLDENSKFSHMR